MSPPAKAFSLRPVTSTDAVFLLALYASTRADEMALVPWTDEQKQAFLRMQFEAQSTAYAEQFAAAEYLVISCAGEPAGRLIVDRTERSIGLIDIALLPAHRGSGIGTVLLQQLCAEAESAGKPLRIHVERMNRALNLYQRLGFRLFRDEGVYLLLEWRAGVPGPQVAGSGPASTVAS